MARSSKKQDLFIGYDSIEENWTTLIWNGIPVPRYQISDHGRLYDNLYQTMVACSLDKDGYWMASIYIDGLEKPYKKIRLHRFELMSFDFRPDFIELQANHKDGNKLDLVLSNLEWTTPMGNTRHGWDNGLNNNRGINNGNGKYTDDVIHEICRLLDLGLSNAQICDSFNIFDKSERMKFSAIVSGVKLGKTHRYISNNYHFMQGANVSNRYGLEFAELVCQFLSDPNREFTYKEIMDFLQIPNEERANFRVYINDLLQGRTAKSVTCKYNLKRPLEGNSDLAYLMR